VYFSPPDKNASSPAPASAAEAAAPPTSNASAVTSAAIAAAGAVSAGLSGAYQTTGANGQPLHPSLTTLVCSGCYLFLESCLLCTLNLVIFFALWCLNKLWKVLGQRPLSCLCSEHSAGVEDAVGSRSVYHLVLSTCCCRAHKLMLLVFCFLQMMTRFIAPSSLPTSTL